MTRRRHAIFFLHAGGPSPKDLPPRWDKQMKGLPGLSSGTKLFENDDYLAAVDDWIFPAIYGRYEASDVITMLYMTGRLPDANKCLGAIWSQHGGERQPRVAAYLAQAFAAGWGVRQNPEKAYLWALHAYRKEPFVIDPAPFAARLTQEQRMAVEKWVPHILKEHFYEMYILPEDLLKKGGEANPLRKLGLALCRDD
jgi:hypothetical protein